MLSTDVGHLRMDYAAASILSLFGVIKKNAVFFTMLKIKGILISPAVEIMRNGRLGVRLGGEIIGP